MLRVNGLEIEAAFDARDRERWYLPLLKRLTALQRERGRRIVCFLAGPPGAGKSTLCLYLEKLSRETPELEPIQALGIDGFHYPQVDLDSRFIVRDGARVPLARVKGAPESYDAAYLADCLARVNAPGLRFPAYDRRIHDPVPNAIAVEARILILEGNWLLLNEPPWNALPSDYSVFLRADAPEQLERIVRRKMMGGYPEAEARAFVMQNDARNIRRCMENSRRGDLNLAPAADGTWEEI